MFGTETFALFRMFGTMTSFVPLVKTETVLLVGCSELRPKCLLETEADSSGKLREWRQVQEETDGSKIFECNSLLCEKPAILTTVPKA